jgi:hypothetical protein
MAEIRVEEVKERLSNIASEIKTIHSQTVDTTQKNNLSHLFKEVADLHAEMKKPLEYKDEEGRILKGFSQVDLDLLHKAVVRLTTVMGTIGALGIAYIVWLTYYVITNGVVNNIVGACI